MMMVVLQYQCNAMMKFPKQSQSAMTTNAVLIFMHMTIMVITITRSMDAFSL